jgi:small-conductance mechanosensitive channel
MQRLSKRLILIRFYIIFCCIFFSLSVPEMALSEIKEVVVPSAIHLNYAGVDIADIYYGIGSFSPSERVEALRSRIIKLAKSKFFDTSTLSVVESENASDVAVADLILVSITDHDAKIVNSSRQQLAFQIKNSIKLAIEKERSDKSPQSMTIAIGQSAAATIALIFIMWGLIYITNLGKTLILNSKGTLIRPIRIRSFEIFNEHRIANLALSLLKLIRFSSIIIIFYFYLPLVLSLFPITANIAPKLLSFVMTPLNKVLFVFLDFIPNLFFIIIIVIISKYILGFIKVFFKEIENETLSFTGFHSEWGTPTYKLVRILVIAFTLVVIFPYIPGSSSPAFQGVSVFLGVLLSFGSSSSIGNIVAGIIITYMRPFKIGDRVKISDTMGDVVEKTLLVTRIRTIKNVDVTIPNSMVLGSHIINFSSSALSQGLILNTTVTIGYDVPWKIIHELLIKAALNSTEILSDPKPYILQTSLDDFYVSYELNAYTRESNKMASIYSQLHQNIQDSFNTAGVEIMSPHYKALRDGNEVTIPAKNRNKDYRSPLFKVEVKNADGPAT